MPQTVDCPTQSQRNFPLGHSHYEVMFIPLDWLLGLRAWKHWSVLWESGPEKGVNVLQTCIDEMRQKKERNDADSVADLHEQLPGLKSLRYFGRF